MKTETYYRIAEATEKARVRAGLAWAEIFRR